MSESTTHTAVHIAVDLADEFGAAGSLIPAGARADYRAAAEACNVELLFTGDAADADNHQNHSTFEERAERYDAMTRLFTVGVIASAHQVAASIDEHAVDGKVTKGQVLAGLRAAGADVDEWHNIIAVEDHLEAEVIG